MCDLVKAKEMRNKAKELDLINCQLLEDVELVAKTCNGIGAEWFPEWIRWAVTKLHPTLEVVSYIHDMEYEIGGGIWVRMVNDFHWLCNGFTSGMKTYSWKQLRRYIVCGQTILFYILLRFGGQAAFHWSKKEK